MTLSLNLLGTPKIYLDDQLALRFRTRKAQALLIYLAATDRSWTRDALATLFWPETDDATARKNLRDILPPLRRQLDDYLKIDDDTMGLAGSKPYFCDVTKFSGVLEQPLQAIETQHLADTLALYRGEFLEGYTGARISADFEMWGLRERERLQQLALVGFTTLCRRQQEAGTYEAALITNRRLLKLAPWDEMAHRQQMLLLAQSGQQAAALAHFDACRQILLDELDVEPDEETVQLYEEIKAGRAFAKPPEAVPPQPPAVSETQAPPHNLPRQLTGLIGRETDIAAVMRLLSQESTALLTLIGQGGVGKTRLALAVAQQLRQDDHGFFPDGIWFVSLAGIIPGEQAAEQIAGAIAQAMTLSLSGSDPLTRQLLRALQAQRALLVLDNFEQLVAEQAFLLEIVQTARQVKLLVTSRAQLRLHAEHLYPVAGLPVPTADEVAVDEKPIGGTAPVQARQSSASRPMDLGQYPGVQLFVARVQQRLPEFGLTPHNQPNIGRVCRLLGGVPLGIELTAQLYVEQGGEVLTQLIAEIERLDPLERPAQDKVQGLDQLQTPAIDLPPRQRTIRAVFLHSWQLLTVAEQELLQHCAIFRGGFTREAILTVGQGDGATLLALVTKSLVRRDSHDRYDLHELIRQYVIEQFQRETIRVHAAAHKHAAYFTDLMAGQEERLLQEPEFHRILRTEIYNIRAAWSWQVNQSAVAALERAVVCLFIYLRYASQIHEALAFATIAIQRLQPLMEHAPRNASLERLLGYLYIYAASAGFGAGRVAESERWLQQALTLGEALADPGLLGQIHATIMIKSSLNMDTQQMAAHAEQALQLVNEESAPHLQPVILRMYSIGLIQQGKIAESFQVAEDLQQLIQRRRYHCIAGEAFFLMSKLYEVQQDWEAALQSAQQGRDHCLAQAVTFGLDNLEGNLIWANLQLGNFAQARALALGFAQRARRTGKQAELLYALQTLGLAERGLGNEQASETHLMEALTVAVATNNDIRCIELQQQLGILSLYRAVDDAARDHFQAAFDCAKAANHLPLQLLAQTGLALTDLRQGRSMQALRALESMFDRAQTIQFAGSDHYFLGLAHYEILAAHQDPRADAMLEQLHHRLQTEAARIKERSQRHNFLTRIPEHRELMALWQASRS